MSDVTQFMKLREFETRYKCSHSQLYREVAAGRLIIRKLGRASRISVADAEAWAAGLPSHTGEAAND